MGGNHSRNKGLNFERDTVKALRKMVFPYAKRHLESQKEEAKGYDLDNTGPFKIQCKRYKKYCSVSKIKEVQTQPGEIPVLIQKADREETLVTMYEKDWLKLVALYQDIMVD